MSSIFLMRLIFDLTAAGLLLFGFSYWWLGNLAHEVAGTALFLLVIIHNLFNRRWYRTIPNARREPRSLFNTFVTFILIVVMLVLMVTSILISNALSSVMSAYGGFTVMQIHTMAAYWALVIVAIHLGLRWPLLMGLARNALGLHRTSLARTVVLRLIAITVAAHGVWSSFELGLGSKLSMQMTLDWWNFEESVAGFFIHCIAIAGLFMLLSYYTSQGLQWRKRKAGRSIPHF